MKKVAPRIIDADGHVVEDLDAILKRMPAPYTQKSRVRDPFPPLDHLHSSNLHIVPPGSFPEVGPDGWLEFLDDVGIESTILYPTRGLAFGKVVSRDWAVDLARAYNDWLYETYLEKNARFKAMALIPLQDPYAAAAELRHAVSDLGMYGAMLPSTGIQVNLGREFYWPIYEEANRLRCCLAIHGGAHANLGLDDLNPYAPVHALGHPFGQMICFAAIVFNGLCDKFSCVRFGFLEGGVAWFLTCLERFDRSYETHIQYDPRGEFLQLEPGESVSEYILRHVGHDRIFISCEGREAHLPYAIRTVGHGPFIYATDFPHEVNSEYCKEGIWALLEDSELSSKDTEAIFHRNAERYYSRSGPATAS